MSPWIDEAHLFQRNAASGTQNMIAASIGVGPARWKGTPTKSADDMKKAMLTAGSDAEATLGILSATDADPSRGQIRELAFQPFKTACAVTPDSTPTALDKANVRSGAYPIWGPSHFLSPAGGANKALTTSVVGYLTGAQPLPTGIDLVQTYAKASLVPLCAMTVSRTSDGGPTTPFHADRPCGCYFDALTVGASSCQACTTSATCPSAAPLCSFGYCEASP